MAALSLFSAAAGGLNVGSGILGLVGANNSADGTLLGGKMAAEGALQAGQAERDSLYYKAAGLRQNAQSERVGGQSDMFNVQRKTNDLQSTLRARAAASGGATDPTVLALSDQIETQGTLDALTEMWKGEDRARGLVDQARGAEMSGDAALTGSQLRARGIVTEAESKAAATKTAGYANLLDKASSMFDRFGKGR
jgi:hypothetical protein